MYLLGLIGGLLLYGLPANGQGAPSGPLREYDGWPMSMVCNHVHDQFCYLSTAYGLPSGAGNTAIVRFFRSNLSAAGVIPLGQTEYDAGQLSIDPSGEHLFALTRNGDTATWTSPSSIVRINVGSFAVGGRTPFALQTWSRISSSRIVSTSSGTFGFAASDFPPSWPNTSKPFDTVYLARFWDVTHPKTLTTQFTAPPADIARFGSAGSRSHAVDPNRHFVVFVLTTWPVWVVKVDIVTWNIVGTLRIADSPSLSSHVISIDPSGTYAFITTQPWTGDADPPIDSAIYKIRLSDLTVVASTRVPYGNGVALSMVMEPTGTFGYIGYSPLSRVLKVRLADLSAVEWTSLTTAGHGHPYAAAVDPSGTSAIFASQNFQNGKVYLDRVNF